MLSIRPEQFAMMEAACVEEFLREAERYVRAHLPVDRVLAPDVIRARVRDAYLVATRFNFHESRALTTFITLSFTIGPCFHEYPRIHEALSEAAGESNRIHNILAIVRGSTPK